MSGFDLVVRGGDVVTAAGVQRADVGVSDGVIAAVEPELTGAAAEIDATGLHVFPGGLDPHVHFNEPGRTHWEGLATGSAALAAGGFTAFFDMPLNSSPPTIDARRLRREARRGARELVPRLRPLGRARPRQRATSSRRSPSAA